MISPQRAMLAAAVVLLVLMAPACSEDEPQPDLRATITALEAKLAVLEAQTAAPALTPTPAPTPTPEVVYVSATPEVVYVTVVVTPTPTPTPIPTPPSESAVVDPAVVEALVLDLVNAEREAAGLKALFVDPRIVEIARWHSESMAAKGFAPVGSGADALSRAYSAGYECWRLGYSFGENTAESIEPGSQHHQNGLEEKHARLVVAEWMADQLRRNTVLHPDMAATGVGVAVERFSGHGWDTYVYVTQNFSSCSWRPKSES